jgi:hypothetical protein
MDQTPSIDTNATLVIEKAPMKLAGAALGSAAFVAAGAFMTQATTGTSRYSADSVVLWGWVTVVFFGFCLLMILWRLLTQQGPIITLSPHGILDVRVTHVVVPWQSVARIFTWSHSGQSIMIVGLHPGEEQKLKLTTVARVSRRANAALGADGLAITSQGTKFSHDALMNTAIAYAQAHGRG